ncbi:MAG: hypothetical protein O2V44_08380 [Candidatus Bathyarchaeota archaeon]|jgi:hypothetical protein|nr:hypothetical protein [Candidatus Bathyarchaeota archaeon]
MNKKTGLTVAGIFVVIVASFSVWSYINHLDYLEKTVHESERWMVIMDSKGDIIAVETTSNVIWNQLEELYASKERRWIGGIVEEYNNKWGFRLQPDTITIAEITIEGAQSNIHGISGDLNYWIKIWANIAYVMASVVEIHE